MYAIAIVRYRKPIADVEAATDDHRAYLKTLHAQGLLLASGPMVPRNGGVLLFRVPDADANATLDRLATRRRARGCGPGWRAVCCSRSPSAFCPLPCRSRGGALRFMSPILGLRPMR